MYDVHRLRLLREVGRRGTVAATAAVLGYSPSSVSYQLSVLAREVGTPLLEPHGRRVRLTSAAHLLVQHAEVILLELERAEADIAAIRSEVAGTIRVATFQTAAHCLLPDALDVLARRHPLVQVVLAHLPAQAAIPALIARDYDLVLTEEYPGHRNAPSKDTVVHKLLDEPMLACSGGDNPATEWQALAEEPWALEPAGTPARQWALSTCHEHGFAPRIAFETSDVFLQRALVAQGRAVAFLPQMAIGETAIRQLPTGYERSVAVVQRAGTERHAPTNAARDALHRAADASTSAATGPV